MLSYSEVDQLDQPIILNTAKSTRNSSPDYVNQILPDIFIIWLPRDIVGGDIYYVDKFSSGFIVAVIDCAGHGVPGAFMTMLASSGLRRITVDENCLNPAKILERLMQSSKHPSIKIMQKKR